MNAILKQKLIDSGIIPNHITQLFEIWGGQTCSEEVKKDQITEQLITLTEDILNLVNYDEVPKMRVTRLDAESIIQKTGKTAAYIDSRISSPFLNCKASKLENGNLIVSAHNAVLLAINIGGLIMLEGNKFVIMRCHTLYRDDQLAYLECEVGC